MKYRLIKLYPKSPNLGTIVKKDVLGYTPLNYNSYSAVIPESQVEDFPEFWEPINEDKEDTAAIFYNDILDYIHTSYFRTHPNIYNEENAVRLTCKKIGFAVEVSLYKSAIQNKNTAQKILRSFIEQNISKLSKL